MSFSLTAKQQEAWGLLGSDATHVMLGGGSRSGKTLVICRAVGMRAIAAPKSRHAIFRLRFNSVKSSVVMDTFPKMMELCFPQVEYDISRTDWLARFQNGSEVWFGGLDDKERTEKILGQEFATLFFSECSQIPISSINLALTRLAQKCQYELNGQWKDLRLKAFYDENPPSQAHWSYKQFIRKIEPESGKTLANPSDYAYLRINPADNAKNLPTEYLKSLESMPFKIRQRFLYGEFADVTQGALWTAESIDKNRILEDLPDMQRVVVAVDPSGSGDTDNAGNDDIGIIVAGLGVDGKAYVLEDATVKAGPKIWGTVAGTAYERHLADTIIAEQNFGGEMVRFVLKTAKPTATVKLIHASRGKVVRAEPISALTEDGRIKFAGSFHDLEEELTSMTTNGYLGEKSPNRADAFVWAMSELFPGIVKQKPKEPVTPEMFRPTFNSFPQHGRRL